MKTNLFLGVLILLSGCGKSGNDGQSAQPGKDARIEEKGKPDKVAQTETAPPPRKGSEAKPVPGTLMKNDGANPSAETVEVVRSPETLYHGKPASYWIAHPSETGAITALTEALKDRDTVVRHDVAVAFQKLHPDSEEVVPRPGGRPRGQGVSRSRSGDPGAGRHRSKGPGGGAAAGEGPGRPGKWCPRQRRCRPVPDRAGRSRRHSRADQGPERYRSLRSPERRRGAEHLWSRGRRRRAQAARAASGSRSGNARSSRRSPEERRSRGGEKNGNQLRGRLAGTSPQSLRSWARVGERRLHAFAVALGAAAKNGRERLALGLASAFFRRGR